MLDQDRARPAGAADACRALAPRPASPAARDCGRPRRPTAVATPIAHSTHGRDQPDQPRARRRQPPATNTAAGIQMREHVARDQVVDPARDSTRLRTQPGQRDPAGEQRAPPRSAARTARRSSTSAEHDHRRSPAARAPSAPAPSNPTTNWGTIWPSRGRAGRWRSSSPARSRAGRSRAGSAPSPHSADHAERDLHRAPARGARQQPQRLGHDRPATA